MTEFVIIAHVCNFPLNFHKTCKYIVLMCLLIRQVNKLCYVQYGEWEGGGVVAIFSMSHSLHLRFIVVKGDV